MRRKYVRSRYVDYNLVKSMIHRRLQESGMSQYELSVKSGVPRSCINTFLNSDRAISWKKYLAIIDTLGYMAYPFDAEFFELEKTQENESTSNTAISAN